MTTKTISRQLFVIFISFFLFSFTLTTIVRATACNDCANIDKSSENYTNCISEQETCWRNKISAPFFDAS